MNRLHYVAGALLILVLGYSALWFTLAFDLDDHLYQEAERLRREGHRVRIGDIKVGGFPYRLSAEISRFQAGMAGGGADVSAKSLTAVTHLWTPGHWVMTMQGVTLTLGDRLLNIEGARAAASLREAEDTGTSVAIDFKASAGSALTVNNKVATDAFLSLRYGGPVAVDQALYEATLFDFYGRFIIGATAYSASGTVSGDALPALNKDGLTNWSNGGGLVSVQRAQIAQKSQRIDFEGSLSLDQRLRPLGSFSGLVTGTKSADALLSAIALDGSSVTLGEGGTLSLMIQNGAVLVNEHVAGTVRSVR